MVGVTSITWEREIDLKILHDNRKWEWIWKLKWCTVDILKWLWGSGIDLESGSDIRKSEFL
jgi:hypothetical protein